MATRRELTKRARALSIKGHSQMSKDDLFRAIVAAENKAQEQAEKDAATQARQDLRRRLEEGHKSIEHRGVLPSSISDTRREMSQTLMDLELNYSRLSDAYRALRYAALSVVSASELAARGELSRADLDDAVSGLRFYVENSPKVE